MQQARRPLVAGWGGVSTEAQRVAIAIADRLGGVADWTSSERDAAATIAFQTVGGVAVSYGEAAERADTVLYWGCEPLTLPGFNSIGEPNARYVAAVGNFAGKSLPADEQFELKRGADYEAIAILRAIDAEVPLDESTVLHATGIPLDDWRRLAGQLAASDYVLVVRGATVGVDGPAAVVALTALVQQLQAKARVAVASPPSTGNRTGAENVLTWQTGFPLAVDFSRGYPRYSPGEYSAATMLSRGETDAVLVVDAAELTSLPEQSLRQLNKTPRIVLQSKLANPTSDVEVSFRVAPLAESGGTYYRSDGLALRNGPITGSALAAEHALQLILENLCAPVNPSP